MRAPRLAALAFLVGIALSACAATAAGQVPSPSGGGSGGQVFGVSLGVAHGYAQVQVRESVEVPFTISDLSRDTSSQQGLPVAPPQTGISHQILLDSQITYPLNVTTVPGWSVSVSKSAVFLTGGTQTTAALRAQVVQPVGSNIVKVRVTATLLAPNGTRFVDSQDIILQVKPFYQATVLIFDSSKKAGQYDLVEFPVKITNVGPYLDAYALNVTGDPEFQAAIPAQIFIAPGESRFVNLSVMTPHAKLYELSRTATFFVNVRSVGGTLLDPNGQNDPTVYTAVAIVSVNGAYVSASWYPLFLLGAVGLVLVGARGAALLEERREQKGRPRSPRLTPRQELLLAELKKRDRAQYKERVAALGVLYAERKKTYKEHRKELAAAEREERKRARAELLAERRRRKADRKAAKKAAKAERKRERVLHKAERAKMKVLEAERVKLAKKKRRLDKKAAKKQVKVDKKQAKLDAKEAKKLAKLTAKKTKELAKRQKELAKAEKKAAKDAGRSKKD